MNRIRGNLQMSISLAVLLVATVWFVLEQNYEFLVYAGSLLVLIWILWVTDRRFKYSALGKWAFLVWMLLHMAGGTVHLSGTRLYEVILVPVVGPPYSILKYDQFVHFFCYVAFTLLFVSVLRTLVRADYSRATFAVVLVLASSSIGALNEIIEFMTVVFFASTGVGGYHNTCLDLVGNLLGSATATAWLWRRKEF